MSAEALQKFRHPSDRCGSPAVVRSHRQCRAELWPVAPSTVGSLEGAEMFATLASPRLLHQRVPVNACDATLMPMLTLPPGPRGLVVVTDASGDRTYTRGNHRVAS